MTVVISRVFLKKITPFFLGGIRGIGCINHLYTCYKDDEKVQVLIFEFFFPWKHGMISHPSREIPTPQFLRKGHQKAMARKVNGFP